MSFTFSAEAAEVASSNTTAKKRVRHRFGGGNVPVMMQGGVTVKQEDQDQAAQLFKGVSPPTFDNSSMDVSRDAHDMDSMIVTDTSAEEEDDLSGLSKSLQNFDMDDEVPSSSSFELGAWLERKFGTVGMFGSVIDGVPLPYDDWAFQPGEYGFEG